MPDTELKISQGRNQGIGWDSFWFWGSVEKYASKLIAVVGRIQFLAAVVLPVCLDVGSIFKRNNSIQRQNNLKRQEFIKQSKVLSGEGWRVGCLKIKSSPTFRVGFDFLKMVENPSLHLTSFNRHVDWQFQVI